MSQEFEKSRTYRLYESIDYQEEAIVSKTILKKDAGTVTVFAFDQGQGLSKHTAPFDAMVQIIEGTANITIDETNYQMSKGDMIIMPADIPHAVQATDQFKMLLTMIKK